MTTPRCGLLLVAFGAWPLNTSLAWLLRLTTEKAKLLPAIPTRYEELARSLVRLAFRSLSLSCRKKRLTNLAFQRIVVGIIFGWTMPKRTTRALAMRNGSS